MESTTKVARQLSSVGSEHLSCKQGVVGSNPTVGLFDTTARAHQEYWAEQQAREFLEVFNQHAIECPECGCRKIMPARDYICLECRHDRLLK
jgi:hypothetical protein